MSIKIIAVGKIQKMYLEIQREFEKRLSRYCKLEIIEVQDEQAPEKLSEAQKRGVQTTEWDKILKKIDGNDFVVALDSTGKKLTSVEFSAKLEQWQENKNTVFILGGSLGFPPEALERADYVLSLSEMTYTHSMARIVLIEQIYRGYKIINKEPYHK